MTKEKIVAKNKGHLKRLIEKEIQNNGDNCDLNHIDVSNIKDMKSLFEFSSFNGNISGWDVRQVKDMDAMFALSSFNGDISHWNVFNVVSMYRMFFHGEFSGSLENWKPYNLQSNYHIFEHSKAVLPYWSEYEDIIDRRNAIEKYVEKKNLNNKLITELSENATNVNSQKKNKL